LADHGSGEGSVKKRNEVLRDMNRSLFAVVRNFERFRVVFAKEQNVSVTELRALSRVVEEGRITPKKLAVSLDLSTGAVTAVADRLVESGLITREPHPSDRRSLLLAASPAGKKVVADVIDSYEAMLSRGTAELDDEQLATLDELLELLVAHRPEA
jgi:DNA-binding MarR family transcriptional regulator